MKSLYVTFLALLALLTMITSCGEDTAKKLSSSNSKTTQFLESTKTAVTNIAQSLDNISFASSCTPTGTPNSTSLTNAYNRDAFPCAFTTDTKDFNTPKGIMSVFSGLMCAIENQTPFNYNTTVSSHTVTVDKLDSCLSGLSFTTGNSFTVIVKEQALINNANWTYKVTVDFSSEAGMLPTYAGKQLVVYLRENGTDTGAKVSIGTVGGTNFLGMILQEDSSSNTLRIDMLANFRHFRAVVLGSSASYSGINSFRGAHSIANSGGVVSFYAAGNNFEYQDSNGSCYPAAACSNAMTPTTSFSDFSVGNLASLSSYLTNDSDAPLSFSNARATQFLP